MPTPAVAFGDGQLTVTWQAPPNEGSALTGYEVEIGGGLNAVIARGTALTYTWDGLANGTNYQFRIVAVNAAGRSDPSSWSDPEHPLRQPDAPGTPNVQRGNRYLDLELGAERQQRRSGDRVPGEDAVESEHVGAGRQRHDVPLVATCPTASPSSSRSDPATATWTGARRAVCRSP